MDKEWIELPYWEEWGSITRIHGSALIAFEHSKVTLNNSLKDENELFIALSGAEFKTFKKDHLARIEHGHDLHGMALLRYYSAFETFVRFADFVTSTGDFGALKRPLDFAEIEAIESMRLEGGIDAWSNLTLKKVKQNWTGVYGGRSGIIEVSIIRNAITHGVRRMNQNLLDNASARNTHIPFKLGEEIEISFELLNEYRGRLRSYCRIVSDGLVHIAKGTHRDP